ncbi:MAG: T9SS C-terminal target domain-containing protein [Bacteroidetes bacterium]|nr:MAG: T9SS C-terminal target domain-containing protein [Bacteroidota bacterium]
MKRLLHFFTLVLIAGVFSAQAQVFISENFGSGTFPPSGWSISAQPANWAASPSANAGGTAPEARFAWSPQFNATSRLETPSMDLSANESGMLALSFRHMVDHYGGPYTIGLAYSDKGGAWQNIWTLNPTASVPAELQVLLLEADDFPVNSDDLKLGFFFTGNSFNINFWFIDDVSVSAFDKDLALFEVSVSDILFEDTPVTGSVINNGFGEINSFDLNWQLDDGSVQTQNFSGFTLEFGETYDFETETVIEAIPGNYDLSVWISNVNAEGVDDNPGNDMIGIYLHVFNGAELSYKPLFESFSSSTCPPCAPFNIGVMNPFISQYKEYLTIIKYQMNWPGSGDPYYTPEGGTRRTYYGVNSVPSLVVDGGIVATNAAAVKNAFLAGLNKAGQIQIAGNHFLNGTEIVVDVDLIPSISVDNLRLHVVVVEKTTTGNATSNGETEFHYVMMKMLPNANGTIVNLVEGETYATQLTANLSGTNVEDFDDLAVVIFLQDHATKMIYQSAFTNIEAVFAINFDIHDEQENIDIDGELNIFFSMPVTLIDGSEITNENVADLISYSKVTGKQDVAFTAIISEDKTHIAVTPNENLDFNEVYQIELAPVMAEDGSISDPITITFTTRQSAGAPVTSFSIDDGAVNVPVAHAIEIEFNQAVRMADGAEITNENVQNVVMYHEDDLQGAPVAFEATINAGKTVITVTPVDDLASLQLYMIGVDELLGVDNELSEPVFISFTTEETLSAGFIAEDQLVLYPNPADSKLFVELPDALSQATLRIYNSVGQVVYATTTMDSKVTVDVKSLDAGVYFVEIVAENFRANRKMIISR